MQLPRPINAVRQVVWDRVRNDIAWFGVGSAAPSSSLDPEDLREVIRTQAAGAAGTGAECRDIRPEDRPRRVSGPDQADEEAGSPGVAKVQFLIGASAESNPCRWLGLSASPESKDLREPQVSQDRLSRISGESAWTLATPLDFADA